MKKVKKFIVYGRVSAEEQRHNTSVKAQLSGVKEDVKANNPEAIHVKDFTDVASARSDKRPGLQAALSFCKWYNQVNKDAPVTHLLVLIFDRFFRNRDKSGEYRLLFGKVGVEINSTREWVDYQDSGQVIVLSVREALAQAESMKNSERTKRGIESRLKDGWWIFNAPLGYKKAETLDHLGRRGVLVDDPVALAKRKAMEAIATGESVKKAWQDNGGVKVLGSYNNFLEKLINPFDLGLIDHTFKDGRHIQVKGRHEAIVTEGLQRAVHTAVNRKTQTVNQTERLARNPARQIVLCPNCHYPMTSSTPSSRGVRHEYYSCYTSQSRAACGKKNIKRSVVHSHLENLLVSVQLGPEAIKKLEKKANKQIGKRALQQDLNRAIEINETQQARKSRALAMRLDGELSLADYQEACRNAETASKNVDRCRLAVHGYDEMRKGLSSIFKDIGPAIAKGFSEGADPQLALKAHSFLRMLAPEGVCLDPKTGVFGINNWNQILCGTGLLSVTYDKIKAGLPGDVPRNPAGGGRPGLIGIQLHRHLVQEYIQKYA